MNTNKSLLLSIDILNGDLRYTIFLDNFLYFSAESEDDYPVCDMFNQTQPPVV